MHIYKLNEFKPWAVIVPFLLWFPAFSMGQENLPADENFVQGELLELSESGENQNTNYPVGQSQLVTQFEELLPDISNFLGRLNSQVSKIGLIEFSYDPRIDSAAVKIAKAKTTEKLLQNNPSLEVVECRQCSLIHSEIVNGKLTVSRGIAKERDRLRLTEELGVDGFLSTSLTLNGGNLAVIMNVIEASTGRIILSKVFSNDLQPKRRFRYFLNMGVQTVSIDFGALPAGKEDLHALFISMGTMYNYTDALSFAYVGSFFTTRGDDFENENGDRAINNLVIRGLDIKGIIFGKFNFGELINQIRLGAGLGVKLVTYDSGDSTVEFISPYLSFESQWLLNDLFSTGAFFEYHAQKKYLGRVAGPTAGKTYYLPVSYGLYVGYVF